jgi:hypothetical protein
MFKTVKTSELTGEALDWAVAMCGGYTGIALQDRINTDWYSPSTEWVQGGPIIEREDIATSPHDTLGWAAFQSHTAIDGVIYKDYFGPTLLVAAMRCYVASKLGDSVEVPEELLKD